MFGWLFEWVLQDIAWYTVEVAVRYKLDSMMNKRFGDRDREHKDLHWISSELRGMMLAAWSSGVMPSILSLLKILSVLPDLIFIQTADVLGFYRSTNNCPSVNITVLDLMD